MGCGKLLDACSNYEIFKTGAKINTYVVIILGLIFSAWTSNLFAKVFDLRSEVRGADDVLLYTFVQTHCILYLTSAVGFLWGLQTYDLRYVQLWVGVKIFECIILLQNMLPCITHFNYIGATLFTCIIVLGFGIYITLSVWNLYKELLQNNATITTSNAQNRNTSLPQFVIPDYTSVHRPHT